MNIQIVNTGKAKYRLGDAVLLYNSAAYKSRGVLNEEFKGSIGYEYCKNNSKLGNIEYVKMLVNKHIELYGYDIPQKNETVVHLRIGENRHVNTVKSKTLDTDEKVEKFVNLIRKVQTENLTVVTAMHDIPNPDDNEFKVINILKQEFDLNIRSSSNVDSDFCYLCKAEKLVLSNGNFSILAGMCNENKVYWSLAESGLKLLNKELMKYVNKS